MFAFLSKYALYSIYACMLIFWASWYSFLSVQEHRGQPVNLAHMFSADEYSFLKLRHYMERVHEILCSVNIQCLHGETCHILRVQNRSIYATLILARLFPFLRLFFSDACDRSSIPIVCSGFIVACCSVIPRTSGTALTTWDKNTDLLSEMIVVGRYVCLVKMLIISLATVSAFWFDIGWRTRPWLSLFFDSHKTEIATKPSQLAWHLLVLCCFR